jgi:hypothetical protein
VICSSSAESKQVAMGKWNQKKEEKENNGDSGEKKKTQVIVYCHTPIRYYWSHYEEYLQMMEFDFFNPLAR